MFSPVIKWTGSKRSQAAEIISRFPRHIRCFHEPFVGSGAVMRAVMESDIEVDEYRLSDINADLIRLWNDIRSTPGKLADGYERLWHAMNDPDDDKTRKTTFFNEVRSRFNAEHDTVDFLFLLRTCANGMPRYNSRGEFNTSFHITRDGIRPDTLRELLTEWSTLLNRHNVTFTACSYEDVVTQAGDFLYLDPPYAATKGIYYGAIDYDRFFAWLSAQRGGYALSFDGRCGERDYTYAVPQDLYDSHQYVRSGNSSFRRVTGKSRDSIVFESLYIKTHIMNREETLQKIQVSLEQLKKWHVRANFRDKDLMNRINPAFGFRDTDNSDNLSRTRGVMSIWMEAGTERINVHTLPRGYGGNERNFTTAELTDGQLQAIRHLVDDVCRRELNDRKRAAMNPRLEEMLSHIEAWAKQCAAAAGKQFSAFVSLGKRAYDRDKYHAVVIFENNDQIGSISLRQDADGSIAYNERTPLGGQWPSDEPLDVRDIMVPLRDSIASITGRKIELDAAPAQKQLLDDIRLANRCWNESGMTVDLQVNRGAGQAPEKWQLRFTHDFSLPDKVNLKLTGTRTDAGSDAAYVIATGTYYPDTPDRGVFMQGTGEQVDLLKALSMTGLVEEIDLYETPGQGLTMEADATNLYNLFLNGMNRSFFFSPIQDIRHKSVKDPDWDNDPVNRIAATLYGGIREDEKLVNGKDAKLLDSISLWPQYTFMEQMTAHKRFKEAVENYYEASRRMTDISVNKVGKEYFIRCRIDGEQQLRQPFPEWKYNAWQQADDKVAALTYLAATVYQQELKQDNSQNRGLKL